MNYEKIYNQIIERARTRRLDGYKERHHIIPKCMGGDDSEGNLVQLTAREHFLCHWLLHEIYPSNFKLKFAFVMMTNISKNSKYRYIPSSRVYEYSRYCMVQLNKDMGKMKIGKKYPKLSKSKIGYKFSEEAKKNMSKAQMNMSIESRLNITNSQKDMIWITNGIKNRRIKKEDELPVGFNYGSCLTRSYIQRKMHSEYMKGRMIGAKNPSAKEVFQYTIYGEFLVKYDTIKEAQFKTGIKKIGLICSGKKNCKDFIFSFTDITESICEYSGLLNTNSYIN